MAKWKKNIYFQKFYHNILRKILNSNYFISRGSSLIATYVEKVKWASFQELGRIGCSKIKKAVFTVLGSA